MADNQISTFKTVLSYSVFIILAPISTFFISKTFLFDGLFGASNVTSNVWSAVVSILVLHVALGLYIYKAYNEAGKVRPDKDDKVD